MGSNINSSEKNNSKNSIAFDNNFIDESLTFSVPRDEENRLENYFQREPESSREYFENDYGNISMIKYTMYFSSILSPTLWNDK